MLLFLLLFSYEGIDYHPLIDTMISNVDSAQLVKWNREISGEDKIFHLTDSVHILTRYYDSYGMSVAEDYLYDYFQSLGLETNKQIYWLIGRGYQKLDYESYRWTGRYSGYYIVDDTLMYLVSTDRVLTYSTNGGFRWSLVEEFPSITSGVSSPAPGTLYVYSETGELYFSDNWGNSFQRRDSLLPSSIQDMQFITGKKGWILSNLGVVGRTEDAGMSWDTVNTGVPITRDIFFPDSLNGWFCGYFGRIYHSSDGGEVWIQQTSPVNKNLQGIYFINADTGWICGDDGTVLWTSDGGENWENIGLSIYEDFRVVYFRSSLEGWFGGTNGCLYYTSDGGNIWEEIEIAMTTFNGIFDTGNNVYLCGEKDFICRIGSEYINRNSYLPNAVCNIIAIQPGVTKPETTVVIGAHCDSWSGSYNYIRAPGANDNATGVNAIREAARILSEYDFDYTIEYILFGAEELWMVGSEYCADEALKENKPIKGVINLDCVGYNPYGTPHEIRIYTDSIGGADFADLALDIISLYSLPISIEFLDTLGSIHGYDAFSFWENGYPGISIYNFEFGPINTVHDSIHIINPSMHYNMTKLAIAELTYMAGFTGTGIPEEVYTSISLKLNNSIINGSLISFNVSVSTKTFVKISLYDVTGRMVHRVFEGIINENERFDVNKELGSGVYFLRVDSDIGTTSKKIVILGG